MIPSLSPAFSPTNSKPDQEVKCSATTDQIVAEWKSMYWFPCQLSWGKVCIWPPFRRRHVTYKITVNSGIPLRDEQDKPIVIANGEIKNWSVYDSTAWNQIPNSPRQLARYPDYEPIAPNEYVVMVETRYRLVNDVEATVRLCLAP